MNYRDVYLNGVLEEYKKQLKEQKQELKRLPEGNLFLRRQGESRQYMQEIPIEGIKRPIRKGITKDDALINKLARKKYLEISNRLLIAEINNIEEFLKNHIEPSAANVLNLLPKAYRSLPEKCFFRINVRRMRGQMRLMSRILLIWSRKYIRLIEDCG